MTDFHLIELFILKCPVIQGNLKVLAEVNVEIAGEDHGFVGDTKLDSYIKQFDIENRINAIKMARYYRIFYMLENDIRKIISDTMNAAHRLNWWDTHAPQNAKDEAKKNRDREAQSGVTFRSEDDIDYITFGQLSDVIRSNWIDFAGMMSNQAAVMRVLSGLNMLRGTIAHCRILADDEIDRLNLSIFDWFRVLKGPAR